MIKIILKIFLLLLFLLLLTGSYRACSCGCCPEFPRDIRFTLEPKRVIQKDQEQRDSIVCDVFGCFSPTIYLFPRFLNW